MTKQNVTKKHLNAKLLESEGHKNWKKLCLLNSYDGTYGGIFPGKCDVCLSVSPQALFPVCILLNNTLHQLQEELDGAVNNTFQASAYAAHTHIHIQR